MSFQADIEAEHWENFECPKRCKEEAIFFANWIDLNCCKYDKSDNYLNLGYFGYLREREVKTTEELYKLFKNGK